MGQAAARGLLWRAQKAITIYEGVSAGELSVDGVSRCDPQVSVCANHVPDFSQRQDAAQAAIARGDIITSRFEFEKRVDIVRQGDTDMYQPVSHSRRLFDGTAVMLICMLSSFCMVTYRTRCYSDNSCCSTGHSSMRCGRCAGVAVLRVYCVHECMCVSDIILR